MKTASFDLQKRKLILGGHANVGQKFGRGKL